MAKRLSRLKRWIVRPALEIAVLYGVIAWFWDAFVDQPITIFGLGIYMSARERTYYHWAESLLTALMLYVLLRYVLLARDRAHAARHATDQRLANVLDTAADAIIATDSQGRISIFNQGAEQIYGYPVSEVIGQQIELLLPPELAPAHTHHMQDFGAEAGGARRMAQQGDTYGRRKDGTIFPVDASISKLTQGGQTFFTVILQDITERKRAEAALRAAYDDLESRVEARTAELARANETLREARADAEHRADELDAVFAALADPVLIYNPAGTIIRANPAARAMAGVELAQMDFPSHRDLGRQAKFRDSAGRPVAADGIPSARALRGETVAGERFLMTAPDAKELILMITAAPVIVKGQVAGAVVALHDITEREQLLARLQGQTAALQQQNEELARLYAGAQRLAVLEERQRLARELHDSVSQTLYSIALGTRTARALLDRDARQAVEPLEYVLSLADAGLTEMRALIFELRPESLEREGLQAALTKQAAALRARYGIEVHLDLCGEPDLPFEVKEAFYRIAQEAMHNTAKHAHATRILVSLCQDPDATLLVVVDDGIGFDPAGVFPGHLGLHTMRERAARLGGCLTVDSAAGSGTTVHVCIPLHVSHTDPASATT